MATFYNTLYLENTPYYTSSAPLEGVSYKLTIRYATKTRSWYLDVATRDGVLVLAGIKLVPNYPLLMNITISALKGNFLLYPTQEANLSKLETNPELLADYFGLLYYYEK